METLQLNIKKEIGQLTFNRPAALNSYNWQMSLELNECLNTIAEDNTIKVLILQGAGAGFMAGGDVQLLAKALDPQYKEDTVTAIRQLHEAIETITDMGKIVIAKVHGAVAGAGLSFMLAADLAYAADDTIFYTAYLDLGLSPDGGLTHWLPRHTGMKHAMELLILAEKFDAKTAYKLNLVNKILPAANLDAYVHDIATNVAQRPTGAIAKTKSLLQQTWQHDLITQLAHEANDFVACTHTEDFAARVKKFLAKHSKQAHE